ncbi:MAG TPA: hypothetical protein VF756_03800 [Thermoanaerobaculia bacterium]
MIPSFHKKGRYSSYAQAAELPHPKLEPEVFIILHRVLIRALEILSADAQPLATMHEDPITSALARVIENRLRLTGEVSGFCAPFFERVTRQHECDNFDGSLQRERPDLFFGIRPDDSFRTRIQSDQWGIFAECKPVDAIHSAGSDYCEGGLARFVQGKYAWAMQDALMVAYARDGRAIASHLIPAMTSRAHLHVQEVVAPVPAGGCDSGKYHEGLHFSTHARLFEWTDGRGPACPITIYHSWHDCENRAAPVALRTNAE